MRGMRNRLWVLGAPLVAVAGLFVTAGVLRPSVVPVVGAPAPPADVPFPLARVVPLPDDRASFQYDGEEKLRYHYPKRYLRPYWFPLVGPAGRPLTRITHPRDPESHSHHKSIWIAHHSVNGNDFWSDKGGTRIVHDGVVGYEDGPQAAAMTVRNRWLDPQGRSLLTEVRRTRMQVLPEGELIVDLEIRLSPTGAAVTFGKTPFGFLGVRVAKTMGVHDGGGRIRNSEGGLNEEGVLWRRARWVDYSGPVRPAIENGIAFMDHPANPRHPTYFHVRDDGWMGASFCYEGAYTLGAGETLTLRYRLYAHRGGLSAEAIERRWRQLTGG